MLLAKQWKKIVFYFILFAALGLFLLEILVYPGVTQNRLGVNYLGISFGLLLVLPLLRFVFRLTLPTRHYTYLLVSIPLFTIVSTSLVGLDRFWFMNASYTYLGMPPVPFFGLSVFLSLLVLLVPAPQVLRRYRKWVLFGIPFVGLLHLLALKWHNYFLYVEIIREDSVIEYITFGFYLMTAVTGIFLLKKLPQLTLKPVIRRLWQLLFMMLVIGSVFIALEEISWGQRLIGIETPEAWREINLQDETTIHNVDIVFAYVYHAYFLLGFYGLTSWMLRFTKLKMWLVPFLSRWYLASYFLWIVVYVWWRFTSHGNRYNYFEEVAEMFLAMGIWLLFYHTYLDFKRLAKG
jgi:hypothetical protein